MTGEEHYKTGEQLLVEAFERDAGISVAMLTVALANAHFAAAQAYAAIKASPLTRRLS